MSLDRVSSTIKEIGGQAESAVGDAIGDRGAQIGGRLRTAEGRSEKVLADAGVAIREAADNVSGYADEAYERGARSLREGRDVVADQVAGKPVAALLIAGLVGYGLGLLIHRA
ncbi:MAG: hypothetical protein K2Y56_06290 [Methylobacterium sp.]|uniref:CsbD family protein n=1 Tax=Methylobacterium sp. TaxID=409 RepID=UPI0025DAEBF9|nr:hypothetical protein [Methylobacterium sp.]MBX9931133.1 hypothetical protein [Methylobacterium sp.]